MGIAIIHKNKRDDSTIWNFNRTWIEFKPAINGVVRKIYIPESMADLLMNTNGWDLYDMFESDNSMLSEYNEVA